MVNVAQLHETIFDEDHRQMFLNTHGWELGAPVGRDSSIRRYFRVTKGKQTAILMETVTDDSPHATPGHSLAGFIMIAGWLDEIGLKVPQIYAQDLDNGYLLLEDLGDQCFRDAVRGGEDVTKLYEIGAAVLEHMGLQDCPLNLPHYYDSHVHRRHRRVVDWYLPLIRQRQNDQGTLEAYLLAWQEIERYLPPCPQGFVHVDFHAQNLMWLPQEQGLKQCGILDFQGAMIGPQPYDLANLLEDARNDIPDEIKAAALANRDETFRAWYRVLATQFHCRVIGQFIKQAVIDDNPQYLHHISRLERYIREGLKDPVLAPLKTFFDGQSVGFSTPADLQKLETLSALVAADAQ